jgi:dihydropyrimidinase
MQPFDLIVKGGEVATASDRFHADIGIREGRITALATDLGDTAERVIDAGGLLVLPGGIEAHCHIAQESASGIMTADDYESGSIAAAFGGNTSFIPFAAQHRGQSVSATLDLYDGRAGPKSVIDYG